MFSGVEFLHLNNDLNTIVNKIFTMESMDEMIIQHTKYRYFS